MNAGARGPDSVATGVRGLKSTSTIGAWLRHAGAASDLDGPRRSRSDRPTVDVGFNPRPGRLALFTVLVASLLAMTFARPAVAQESPRIAPGAEAAIVIDAATGAVLFERNARVAMHPASLTKMMTALTAVERAPLNHVVKVNHEIV